MAVLFHESDLYFFLHFYHHRRDQISYHFFLFFNFSIHPVLSSLNLIAEYFALLIRKSFILDHFCIPKKF